MTEVARGGLEVRLKIKLQGTMRFLDRGCVGFLKSWWVSSNFYKQVQNLVFRQKDFILLTDLSSIFEESSI